MHNISYNLTTTITYYIICYTFILFLICISMLLNNQNLNINWNTNITSAAGPRLLLFLSLLSLTGLPPMFTLAPKLHLICYVICNSSILGVIMLFSLILLSWFVYYSALHNFTQSNINKQLSYINQIKFTNNTYTVFAILLILLLIAPLFVDDIILWIYYYFGL